MLDTKTLDGLPSESIDVLKELRDFIWRPIELYSDSQLKPLFEHGIIDTEEKFIRLTFKGKNFCSDFVWDYDDLDSIPF